VASPVNSEITVLVVDDEPIVREVVARYLRREGYRALEAADGPAARDLIERHPPSLVVLDEELRVVSASSSFHRIFSVKPDDLTKQKLEPGKIIQLKNIYFEFDKDELMPRSFVELNKLLKIMRENPKLVIEIMGHTDSFGDDDYNLDLSRRRALAVVNFLLENKINKTRLRSHGEGEAKPIASNETDEGRAQNGGSGALAKYRIGGAYARRFLSDKAEKAYLEGSTGLTSRKRHIPIGE